MPTNMASQPPDTGDRSEVVVDVDANANAKHDTLKIFKLIYRRPTVMICMAGLCIITALAFVVTASLIVITSSSSAPTPTPPLLSKQFELSSSSSSLPPKEMNISLKMLIAAGIVRIATSCISVAVGLVVIDMIRSDVIHRYPSGFPILLVRIGPFLLLFVFSVVVGLVIYEQYMAVIPYELLKSYIEFIQITFGALVGSILALIMMVLVRRRRVFEVPESAPEDLVAAACFKVLDALAYVVRGDPPFYVTPFVMFVSHEAVAYTKNPRYEEAVFNIAMRASFHRYEFINTEAQKKGKSSRQIAKIFDRRKVDIVERGHPCVSAITYCATKAAIVAGELMYALYDIFNQQVLPDVFTQTLAKEILDRCSGHWHHLNKNLDGRKQLKELHRSMAVKTILTLMCLATTASIAAMNEFIPHDQVEEKIVELIKIEVAKDPPRFFEDWKGITRTAAKVAAHLAAYEKTMFGPEMNHIADKISEYVCEKYVIEHVASNQSNVRRDLTGRHGPVVQEFTNLVTEYGQRFRDKPDLDKKA